MTITIYTKHPKLPRKKGYKYCLMEFDNDLQYNIFLDNLSHSENVKIKDLVKDTKKVNGPYH